MSAKPLRKVHTPRSRLRRIGHIALRALHMEIGVWVSIWRWMTRRPRGPVGAQTFGYDAPVRSTLIAFVVVSIVEVAAVDLVVHRWPTVRIPLLIAGIWGVTWMVGLLLGYLTRPHAVGSAGVLVRNGAETELRLPWQDIASVARRHRAVRESGSFLLSGEGDGQVLYMPFGEATEIDIELERPLTFRLPPGTVTVRELRIYTDDPTGFLAAAREHALTS